jgi:hypothetical protein
MDDAMKRFDRAPSYSFPLCFDKNSQIAALCFVDH